MLRSDPSARAGLREAVCMSMLPFFITAFWKPRR